MPEPLPDKREPVPDNWEQGLEPLDPSIDSDDGQYKGPSQECQESQEGQQENELEQHGDDEDLFVDWGEAQRPIGHEVRNLQASILTITPGNTQSSSRIGYPEHRIPSGKCRSVVQGGPERSWSTKGVVVPVVPLVHSDPL